MRRLGRLISVVLLLLIVNFVGDIQMAKLLTIIILAVTSVSNGMAQSGQATIKEKRDLLQQLGNDGEDIADISTESVKVKKIDLNNDSKPEYIVYVEELCGASGSCDYWIYGQRGSGFVLLLKTFAYSDFAVKPAAAYTNGYRNLTAEAHGDAESTSYKIYKYNGDAYEATDCFSRKFVGRGKSKRIKATRYRCHE